MSSHKLILSLFLTLTSCLILEDLASAQRGGRSSGSSGSSSRSSGSSSRSMGSSSRSTGSSSSRGTSRSSYSSPSRSSVPSRPSTRTTTTRSIPTTTRTSSSSRGTSSGYSSRSSLYDSPATQSRTRSGATTPTVDLSGRDSAAYTGSGASSTGSTSLRTSSPTVYDLSRRGSTSRSTGTGLESATVHLSSGASRTTRPTSTVPRAYSSRSSESRSPAIARRSALSDRLRRATSERASAKSTADGLVDRYTPSSNEKSTSLRRSGDSASGLRPAGTPERSVARPGLTRRSAYEKTSATRKSEAAKTDVAKRAAAARKKHRIEQARADRKAIRTMNARYDAASKQDPELRKRMAAASRKAAIASDYVLRKALDATRLPGLRDYGGIGSGGYGDENGGYGDNDRWSDYGYGGWSNWYWNSCFPFWNSWCFNYCSSWCFGWGWGYNCWYNPCWGWPYYSPGSYGYSWPTYAYYSPGVVYNYYYDDDPIYREVVAEPEEDVAVVAAPHAPDVSQRAATEYMALGDRAFTEGRYGDAVHYYAKAIEFAPEDGVLYLVLSDALFATGDYHYAAFALRRSLELHPEIASLGLDKRTFYGNQADFDQQLALLEKYVSDHVIDNDARLVLGANYLFSSQPEKCVQFFDQAFCTDVKQSASGQLLFAASLGLLATSN